MNIAILLPYKENYTKDKAGAVSIFLNQIIKYSSYKNNTTVYGSTDSKKFFKNYINIKLTKKLFQSNTNQYLNKFIKIIESKNIDILEIHNRPHYVKYLKEFKFQKVLFFHNDPLSMQGSINVNDRIDLINNVDKIIFNSNWSKLRFFKNLLIDKYNDKVEIVYQSTSKTKIDFNKKKKIISFIGKLNTSKGYDIFGETIVKILNKYKDWRSIVIGDEPREKFSFNHKNLIQYGFQNNAFILNKLKNVSISVIPSKWDEPFGRVSLESASRGCAIITSNTGGLKETTDHSIVLKKINSSELYKKIEFLIKNNKFRKNIQKKTHSNFYLTNKFVAKQMDVIRNKLSSKNIYINIQNTKNIKILHITNFNDRFDGRLHYNTGKRINNGLIRNKFNVLNISDRDVISNNRQLTDPYGYINLNKKIISNFDNFNPDLILLGHSDSVSLDTLDYLKNKRKSLKIAQWFLDPVSRNGPDYIKNKNRFTKFQKFTDANFITTNPDVIEFQNTNTYFMPNPSDESFETLNNFKFNNENDLFFAMSHGVHRGILKKNKSDIREKFLRKILNIKDIKCDFYGIDNKQPVWGDLFKIQLSKSNMGLNLSRGKPVKYYSSDRIAQIMGNGLLCFIDEKTCYSDFFNKNEIVTYNNSSDLIENILKFKKDIKYRKFVAANGKKKYMKIFNSNNVAKYIVNKTLELKNVTFW